MLNEAFALSSEGSDQLRNVDDAMSLVDLLDPSVDDAEGTRPTNPIATKKITPPFSVTVTYPPRYVLNWKQVGKNILN